MDDSIPQEAEFPTSSSFGGLLLPPLSHSVWNPPLLGNSPLSEEAQFSFTPRCWPSTHSRSPFLPVLLPVLCGFLFEVRAILRSFSYHPFAAVISWFPGDFLVCITLGSGSGAPPKPCGYPEGIQFSHASPFSLGSSLSPSLQALSSRPINMLEHPPTPRERKTNKLNFFLYLLIPSTKEVPGSWNLTEHFLTALEVLLQSNINVKHFSICVFPP